MFLYAALGAAVVISMAIAWNSYAIRSNARWFIRGVDIKLRFWRSRVSMDSCSTSSGTDGAVPR